MNGSTENQREQQANQLGAAIDPQSGQIVIFRGGLPLFGMAPKDAAAFCGGLCQLLAQHPQLQATVDVTPPILIAGTAPPFNRLNGHR